MKKFLLMIIMFFLITSKVQAVSRSDYISLESTYTRQDRNLDFFNNLLNDFYERNDINLLEYSGINNISSFITSKDYYYTFIPADNNKIWVRISMNPMYFYISQSSNGYTLVGNWSYYIDVDNKIVTSTGQDDNYLTQVSVEYRNNITSEKWYSDEFQEFLLYNYVLFYNGEIKNSSRNKNLNYKQRHNKNNFWDYTEDGIYSYWSGDITLYEDYFEVKDFETNVSDFSMYLLQYKVIQNEFGEYILPNGYSWFEISKPNQGGTSTWQISNISDIKSGDRVYTIGIGTSDTPDLIRSEWFDSDDNLSNFMNSKSFRLRYYVENLPDFFLIEETQRPSGDIANGVIDGNENYWGSQNDLNGSQQEELISGKVDELTEQISGDLTENEIFGILKTYEDKLFGGFTGEKDFKISWNNVSYMDSVIIPAGEINFSQICRENEALGKVKTTVNIILGFMLLYNCVIYLYNLLLATLGIDNPYLYEKPQDVTTTSYSVDMKTGKTTETKTTKRKDGIIFTTRRDI